MALTMIMPSDRYTCRARLHRFIDAVNNFDHIFGSENRRLPDLEDIYFYSKNRQALLCPLDKKPVAVDSKTNLRSSFSRFERYDLALAAKVYRSQLPIFYDRMDFEGKGRFVLFADGHLAWLSEGEFKKQIEEINEQIDFHLTATWSAYRRRLESTAKKGDIKSMTELGDYFARGVEGKSDFAEAARWYEKAAALGDAPSMHRLGVALIREGKQNDPLKACQWFQRAAEKGSIDGKFNWGVCLQNGAAGSVDLEKAAQFFEVSARGGYALGAFNRALIYARQASTPENPKLAYQWMYLAHELGAPQAGEALSRLRNSVEDYDAWLAEVEAQMIRDSIWPNASQ